MGTLRSTFSNVGRGGIIMWSALNRTPAIFQIPSVSIEDVVLYPKKEVQICQRKLNIQKQRIQQHSQELLRFEKDLQLFSQNTYKNQITDSQYQSFKKRLDLLKQESSQSAQSLETIIQEYQNIYIASVQYIISTQRCLSKDGHLSFSKGELLNVEE